MGASYASWPIVVRFVAEDTLGSRAIRWGTHSQWSHVGLITPNGYELSSRSQRMKIDSTVIPAGVQARPKGYARFTAQLSVTLPATPEVQQAVWAAAWSQRGKPYATNLLIANFFFERNWRSTSGWFCSELIGWALEVGKWFQWLLATPTNKLAPSDLATAISAKVKMT